MTYLLPVNSPPLYVQFTLRWQLDEIFRIFYLTVISCGININCPNSQCGIMNLPPHLFWQLSDNLMVGGSLNGPGSADEAHFHILGRCIPSSPQLECTLVLEYNQKQQTKDFILYIQLLHRVTTPPCHTHKIGQFWWWFVDGLHIPPSMKRNGTLQTTKNQPVSCCNPRVNLPDLDLWINDRCTYARSFNSFSMYSFCWLFEFLNGSAAKILLSCWRVCFLITLLQFWIAELAWWWCYIGYK